MQQMALPTADDHVWRGEGHQQLENIIVDFSHE